jgi:hypothetical protein
MRINFQYEKLSKTIFTIRLLEKSDLIELNNNFSAIIGELEAEFFEEINI